MLSGREKVGDTSINWSEQAFGKGKHRRKTWGFGKYDKREKEHEKEIHIREQSIMEGGLGCAVWDAAVIMSRWDLLFHFIVLIFQLDLGEQRTVRGPVELGSGCGLPGIMAASFAKEAVLTDYLDPILENLTYNVSMNDIDEDDETVHRLNPVRVLHLDWEQIDNDPTRGEPLEAADILMGSELTYSDLSVDALIKVIKKYMKPDGVFYEVLSDDRDGVGLFIEKIKSEGFQINIHPVPGHMLGNYKTKQREETYKFYTFHNSTVCSSMVAYITQESSNLTVRFDLSEAACNSTYTCTTNSSIADATTCLNHGHCSLNDFLSPLGGCVIARTIVTLDSVFSNSFPLPYCNSRDLISIPQACINPELSESQCDSVGGNWVEPIYNEAACTAEYACYQTHWVHQSQILEIISSPLEAASLAYEVHLPSLEDIQRFYKVLLPVIRDVSVPYSPEWRDLIKTGLLSTFIDEEGEVQFFPRALIDLNAANMSVLQ
ncbi:hypothetical protein PROFUN_05543 [Planoprotostelium fungivorum]|uniref:Uncharacterized protein n=1 Tax=Planoprotostelium fungivorum TaxID=1890364 RepID=A0A2P6N014_9EUKA|nr:hypothetical protein PROFUN_05543 [Planoprotostelium fungivorum]